MNMDMPVSSLAGRAATYVSWLLATMLFSWGLYLNFPPKAPAPEAFVFACVLFAQGFAFLNYWRRPCLRNAGVICALLLWSLGFCLRRLYMIDDAVYSIFVSAFLALVAFVRLNKQGTRPSRASCASQR